MKVAVSNYYVSKTKIMLITKSLSLSLSLSQMQTQEIKKKNLETRKKKRTKRGKQGKFGQRIETRSIESMIKLGDKTMNGPTIARGNGNGDEKQTTGVCMQMHASRETEERNGTERSGGFVRVE